MKNMKHEIKSNARKKTLLYASKTIGTKIKSNLSAGESKSEKNIKNEIIKLKSKKSSFSNEELKLEISS